MVKIGNVEIAGRTVLAPMAGVADSAFRLVCREFGAAYVVSEMVSAKGLCMHDRKSGRLLTMTPKERPGAVQLFGSEPAVMAQAARLAMAWYPDVIDINMGCPAPKVTSNGCGSALMRDVPLAARIIESVVKAVDIPVTVKIRKGWDDDSICAVELARAAEASGAAAVAVHGRTRAQQYAPPVDLDIIARVKAAVHIPVVGNGDVATPEDARRMIEATGCDLVMIGRGALGNPWLFAQTEAFLAGRPVPPAPSLPERMDVMLRHIRLMCNTAGEREGMRQARKHAAWYMRGLRGAAAFRDEAVRMACYDDARRLAQRVLAGVPSSEPQ